MDILIKNFEMPKECIERQGYFDYVYCPMFGICHGHKPKDEGCVLVELQPHGRLIDADELEGILDEVNRYGDASEITYKKMIEILHDETLAPTIVEATE